jgi:hypothetical protein
MSQLMRQSRTVTSLPCSSAFVNVIANLNELVFGVSHGVDFAVLAPHVVDVPNLKHEPVEVFRQFHVEKLSNRKIRLIHIDARQCTSDLAQLAGRQSNAVSG